MSRRDRLSAAAIRLGLFLFGCQMLSISSVCAAEVTGNSRYPNPLPADPDLKVLTLPADYPRSWAVLGYANEKFEIRDVGNDDRAVVGQLPAYESSLILMSTHRPELYVADTIWSRGNRGSRTDFITIYDKRTLLPSTEIVLPGAKRALIVPLEGMLSFADDERLALVYNFTPAASITVVDLVQRKVLSEVKIPGCALAYSTGARGFSSMCSSGTLLSVQLDAKGGVKSRQESSAFNHLDTDPLFTSSAQIDGIRYFPSFHGRVQPIDLSGDAGKVLEAWPLVLAEDEKENWRPSGLQLVAAGDDGHLYVLMQPNGHEGSHKEPGTEVWVFDTVSHARIARLRLARPGTSIEVTHDRNPLLLVAASEQLDVYGLPHGNLVRSLDAAAQRGGTLMQAVK
jgi:methylamine dehydrogenase heavy chain